MRERRLMFLARLALLWEQAWPRLAPAVALSGLFLALALLDVLPHLPGWWHAAVLAAALGGLGALCWRGLRGLRWPDRKAARRRLETASGLGHRPLEALEDTLALGGSDPAARGLWETHRRRMAALVGRLRVGVPRPGLPGRDRRGLRALPVLALAIGVAVAWSEAGERLGRALVPVFAPAVAPADVAFDLWVALPEYTRLPPRYLDPATGMAGAADAAVPPPAPLRVPVGSRIVAQVHGLAEAPLLGIGEERVPFEAVGGASHQAEALVQAGAELSVRDAEDARLLGWPLEVIADQPPIIAFAEPPSGTERKALRIATRASDDYGLVGLALAIRLQRPDGEDAAAEGAPPPLEIVLPLPGGQPREASGTAFHDLTPHPWAGLPVEIEATATDGLGQTGRSETVEMLLPERVFRHPVARLIIEQRKLLSLAPEDREAVAEVLGDISRQPELFDDDTVVFLALRMSRRRLLDTRLGHLVPEVQELLWEIALRLEDGSVALAESRLRELQQALQEALAGDAPDDEIDRLMQELQQALNDYLTALAEQMMQQMPREAQPVPLPPGARVMTPQDLQDMLDRAREMARGGAREAARDMLSQLQDMLENLRSQPFAAPQQDGAQQQAMQMMQDLQDLVNRQQRLMDQTFRDAQRRQQSPPGQDDGQPGESGAEGESLTPEQAEALQEALRRQLGEMMRQLGEMAGEIPPEMGQAERAMRQAGRALGDGQPGEALGPQGEALDALRQAGREMARQMQQQMGPGLGMMPGPFSPGMGIYERMPFQEEGRDPMGRPAQGTGGLDRDDVEIPGESEMQRAREILDELRRRAGDRARPAPERQYIDRLLEPF